MPLSLNEKIGQMLVFGWSGSTPSESRSVNGHARVLIEEFAVGGIILMGRNIGRRESANRLTSELQDLAISNGLPQLLIATDQEGGRIARFGPPDYPAFPSALTIGNSGDEYLARRNAHSIGKMLADVGVNWALMPDLDVNNNPGNTVIGDRSYGDNPQIVSKMGAASIKGMQEDAGVLACGKHFPGHGDTSVDSHLALPVIDHQLSRLRDVELPPFMAAVKAGVGSIMTSHILFRELDPDLPATLSPVILTGLLRQDLSYDGIVITDCLEMKGVAEKWGSAEAAVLAVAAGADMVLACHTESTQRSIQQALIEAVETGRIPISRIDEANTRIARAKERWATA